MIKSEFHQLISELNQADTKLVAVSKTKPIEDIKRLHDWGQRDFGENRIEEIVRKSPQCPSDIQWHLIGPLQSKKVKLVPENIALFHALDRLKIMRMLNEHFETLGKKLDVLLQVHIAREDSKHGFSPEEILGLFEQNVLVDFPFLNVRGLMGMATFTDDQNIVRSEFDQLKFLFDRVAEMISQEDSQFDTLSMGMSGDYKLAISCGSNMVRIGSMIFGARQ